MLSADGRILLQKMRSVHLIFTGQFQYTVSQGTFALDIRQTKIVTLLLVPNRKEAPPPSYFFTVKVKM